VSASEAIAKLRETHKRWVNFDLSMLDEEAEIARSLPALLECAEALEAALRALDLYEVAHDQDAGTWGLDTLNDAECLNVDAATKARLALQALAEGGGE